jgi:hypothetical protein
MTKLLASQDPLKAELIDKFTKFIYRPDLDKTIELVIGFFTDLYGPVYVDQLTAFDLCKLAVLLGAFEK